MKEDKVFEKVYMVGTHRYSFRAGKPAEVIRVEWFTPVEIDKQPYPCFRIRFEDGEEDSVPIFDPPCSSKKNPFYELISEEDFFAEKLPKVIH